MPQIVERFGIKVELSPPAASFEGRKIIGLTPALYNILFALVERGRASTHRLTWRGADEPVSDRVIRTQVSRLRVELGDAGVPVRITAVDGWGYILTQCSRADAFMEHARRLQKKSGQIVTAQMGRTRTGRVRGRNAAIVMNALRAMDELSDMGFS